MTIIPFVCLGAGIILGRIQKNDVLLAVSEKISTVALIFLMIAIGIGIGIDDDIVKEFPIIGLNCVIISVCAILISVALATLCERTIMPLNRYERESQTQFEENENQPTSNLVWIMPISVIVGLVAGIIFKNIISGEIIDAFFTVALIVLYICVGVGQGANSGIIAYMKELGMKILLLPLSIFVGSILGGLIASLICSVSINVSIIAASGMSFYSITGAYMTQTYGVTMGTYGFIVNVLREFITVLTMPLLIRVGKAAPIAGGAAGDMDTMLAPVTKFVGKNLALVTLLTGTLLTLLVPIILPALTWALG